MPCVLYPAPCFANNLAISNFTLVSQDTTANTVTFQFDISWDDSWKDATNHDAAWVFVKYTTNAANGYSHCTLKYSGTNPAGFSIGTGAPVDLVVPADRKGCFIQRSSLGGGSGTLSATSVRIVWDYGADSISDSNANGQDSLFKIFGIEMVYIPQGQFYAGDGASGVSQFEDACNGTPRLISGEAQLTLGGCGAGSLGNNNDSAACGDDFNDSISKTLPAQFPKGFNAFYLMKYEISQGAYTAFLNSLNRTQQGKRVGSTVSTDSIANIYVMTNTPSVSYRNEIVCPASGNGTTDPIVFSCDRSDRACNYVSWMDLCAYADWAALRLFTELEYEKTCRGPNTAVANEYAWGSTAMTAASAISGTEDGTETVTTAGANANYGDVTFSGGDAGSGPLRCGIFATGSSTRTAAGAGYYGNMELCGNLEDPVVHLGSAAGRIFTGTHGDGMLTAVSGYEGNATNTDWPGIDATIARGVTAGTGSGSRGSSFDTASGIPGTSKRSTAGSAISLRSPRCGGRFARTA